MKIAVGSKNAAKMGAVGVGASAYWEGVEVEGVDVESGVRAQPIGMEETVQGAVNRAKAAYAAVPGCALALGLEGGVMEMAGRMVLFGVAAVFDGQQVSAAQSGGVPLPDAWGEALKNGEELGPFIAALFKDYNRKIGTMPFLTKGKILREEEFTIAVKGALAPWVTPEAYVAPMKVAA